MSKSRLDEFARKLQHLTDRQEILDCIVRNSTGNDLFDLDMVATTYHADGLHEVAREPIAGPHYGEHANEAHARLFDQSLHHVTMHSAEIDGDVAHATSYVIGLFVDKGEQCARILSGRYIDRLEKREGEWRIVVRRCTVEVILEGATAMLNHAAFRDRGYLKGSRDKSDLAYARPLTMAGGERWS